MHKNVYALEKSIINNVNVADMSLNTVVHLWTVAETQSSMLHSS